MTENQPKPIQVKLTEWANEPTLEDLKYDLAQAQSSHSAHMADLNRWLANYYIKPSGQTKVKTKEKDRRSQVQPALIRKQAEWRAPALSEPFLATNELFKVDPVTFEDKARALQNELILNNQFNTKIDKVRFIDSAVRTLVREGTVVIRTGWEYQEEKVKIQVPVYQYQPAPPEAAEQYQQLMQMQQAEPDGFEATVPDDLKESLRASMEYGSPVTAVPVGTEEKTEIKVLVNKPTVEVCNIRNVFVDPTCEGDQNKIQFIVHSFESSLSDLKRDGRYKNLTQVGLGSGGGQTSINYETNDTSNFTFKDKARKKLVVYEYHGYWDIDGKGTVKSILAAWVDNVMIRMEENPFPDGKPPFVFIPYIPRERSVYGVPDGELLEDNQKILGAVTRGTIDLLGKSANSQTGIAKGVLDVTNRLKFTNGENYEYNPGNNPQGQIFQHKYPEIPQSAMWIISQQNNEAEALSGTKAFSGSGISGAGLGDTAAAVRSTMDATSKREASVLHRISSGLMSVARKILAMNAEWLSDKEIVRITNSEFIEVRGDDLAGDFDLRLTISTPEADESKAKELAFMLQTMGNSMDAGMSQMILGEIARLRKMPDLAHKILNYQPEPDPMQEEMQKLESARLQAQIELIKAQAAEAMAKSGVQQTKVGVEKARTESLQGDADLKALNFVQSQSGVKHEMEMDKKFTDGENLARAQEIKNQGSLEKQMAQFQLNKENTKLKHNSELLKMKAQQDQQVAGDQYVQ